MWLEGRQGTGYFKKRVFESQALLADCYVLKYTPGSYIPTHVDPVKDGYRHYRLNVVLKSAKVGGKFICGNVIFRLGPITLFRPDINSHSVSEIVLGNRYVFSMGWLLRDRG